MFGFSWSEILIIGVVALVLIGPNDLPRAMRTAARWLSAGRKLAREFQGHVDELVREAELDELREQARKLAMRPIASHLEAVIDPKRELAGALSMPQILADAPPGAGQLNPPVAPAGEPGSSQPVIGQAVPVAPPDPAPAAPETTLSPAPAAQAP
jgi:sec-independent protein translocase protein TatB